MSFNPLRRWTYLEPDDVEVCATCYVQQGCLCPVSRTTVSGGPGHAVVMSEQAIIDEYFAYWSSEMTRIGKAGLISKEGCVEDWVVVHWAYEA